METSFVATCTPDSSRGFRGMETRKQQNPEKSRTCACAARVMRAYARTYIRGCFSPIIYYILNVFSFLCFLVSIVVFSLGVVVFEVATRFFILVSFCFRLVALKLKERARALPLR